MQLSDFKIDLTECWLEYRFPDREDRYAFKLMVKKIVRENIMSYWDDNGFLSFLTDKVIRYLARKDFKPLSQRQITKAITEAFYDTHGNYELGYAGLRRRRKKKNKR